MQPSAVWALERPTNEAADAQPLSIVQVGATRLLVVALILLLATQRLTIPVGRFPIPFSVPIFAFLFMWGYFRRYWVIDPRRMIAYLAAIACLLTSSLVVSASRTFSAPSLLYLVGLYGSFVMVAPYGDLKSFFRSHQIAMVGFSVFGILQFAVQLAGMPFIDPLAMVPESFLLPNYNTIQPLTYGADMIKSNGGLFLEASHLSKAIAVAILIELIYFRRLSVLAIFCCCYATTFSGTGLLVLAVGGFSGLHYISKKWAIAFALLGLVVAGGLVVTGNADAWTERTAEFSNQQSSGTMRFVTPYVRLWSDLKNDFHLFGHGAGSTQEQFSEVGGIEAFDPTPVKLTFEYGPLAAMAFMAFMLYGLYSGAAVWPLKHAVAVLFFFLTGGLLEAPTLFYCYLMVGLVVAPTVGSDGSKSSALPDKAG